MLRALLSLFRAKRQFSPLDEARAARKAAAEAYAHAAQRGDCRDKHWALKTYRRATNELLRLEKAEGAR
jgi:hypothetical protein